jgi:hypothetical protein
MLEAKQINLKPHYNPLQLGFEKKVHFQVLF